jgi:hypothetical protein
MSASAGINRSLNTVQRRIRNLLARAATRIQRTNGLQLVQRLFICRRTLTLVNDRLIAMQPERFQRAQNVHRRTRHATRRIEVFHANQPDAAVMFRVEITADSGDE